MNQDSIRYELQAAHDELQALIDAVEESSGTDFTTMLIIRQIRTRLDYVHNGISLAQRPTSRAPERE